MPQENNKFLLHAFPHRSSGRGEAPQNEPPRSAPGHLGLSEALCRTGAGPVHDAPPARRGSRRAGAQRPQHAVRQPGRRGPHQVARRPPGAPPLRARGRERKGRRVAYGPPDGKRLARWLRYGNPGCLCAAASPLPLRRGAFRPTGVRWNREGRAHVVRGGGPGRQGVAAALSRRQSC